MLCPAVISYISQFYPLGNTTAVNLLRGFPHGEDADVLLLGSGDVRNVLYTMYAERGMRECIGVFFFRLLPRSRRRS
ncbi:hypothetical protein F5Y15DRAFT_382431 [Xylariaceae sp. FL0016]|nr:hypothetical protein F5Y15DRAFT_382431 [Xylariaceae sp. FL0016]